MKSVGALTVKVFSFLMFLRALRLLKIIGSDIIYSHKLSQTERLEVFALRL